MHFDFIFIGVGASASLLLMALHKRELLSNKTVLLIEPDSKTKNDKTFCFWGNPSDSMVIDLEPLITHSWTSVSIAQQESISLQPQKYWQISSLHLYQHIHQLTHNQGWKRLICSIDNIHEDEEGPYINIDNYQYRATHLFDSRNPSFSPPIGYQTHLWQSFYGWKVRTQQDAFHPNDFRMMDFDTEQDGFTQFVYVLPYSNSEALIEITRFGSEIIPRDLAELRLREYMEKLGSCYSVEETEEGCIPMSNAKLNLQPLEGVIPLGGRNNAIKPSTGYAFKTMYHQAETIAQCMADLAPNSEKKQLAKKLQVNFRPSPARFAFYDSLLLHILNHQPQYGKSIFETLFNRVPFANVLSFLDEKTSLTEDIGILKQLPFTPFLRALSQHPWMLSIRRPFYLLLITILLLGLGAWPTVQEWIGNGLLIAGLIWVGIPHGAVDHLLETGRWDKQLAPTFILRYLSISIALALFWMFFPNAALIIFLAYSAWHFGQADSDLWNLNHWQSMAWGCSVLGYILCTHTSESAQIIEGISTWSFSANLPVYAMIPWLLFALASARWGLLITTIWLISSSQLPLLWSFGLYFVGQHSINGWNTIKKHLHITNTQLWFKSLPFHLGAWALLAFFYCIWDNFNPVNASIHGQPTTSSTLATAGSNPLSTVEWFDSHASQLSAWAPFFIFIACISLPHTLAMHKLYKKPTAL